MDAAGLRNRNGGPDREALWLIVVGLIVALACGVARCGEPVLVRDWTDSGKSRVTSWGTAFGIGGGIAVTAAHIIKGGALEVKTADGWKSAKVLTTDADLDIAIIATEGTLDNYVLADKVSSGETFTIEGFPEGVRKSIKAKAKEEYGRKVILDARGMEHGFSGAPVVDGRGCVVGVAVAGLQADGESGDMDHKRAVAVPLDALHGLLVPFMRSIKAVLPVALRMPSTTPQTRAEPVPPVQSSGAPKLLAAFEVGSNKWRAVKTVSAGLVFERADIDALGGESWRKCAADYASEEWTRAAIAALSGRE